VPDVDFAPLAFDSAPLDGTVLVEASAGTGKTWTLAALWIRLLLERGLKAEDILVVTYTKAATAELRERILRRLIEVRDQLARGQTGDALVDHLLRCGVDRVAAAQRLALAIASFDLAPIYTIHGFCQRALAELAFESRMPFETEIVQDESALRLAAAEDFWRREVAEAPRQWADRVRREYGGPAGLLAAAAPALARPYAEVLAPSAGEDLAARDAAVDLAWREARIIWARDWQEVHGLLGSTSLNRTSYSPDWVSRCVAALDRYFGAERRDGNAPEELRKCTPPLLQRGTKKNGTTPLHDFFAATERLLEALRLLGEAEARALAAFLFRFQAGIRAALQEAKRAARLQSYDDLLSNLRRALEGDSGGRLAQALRNRFKAALVDEFQDTDPVQYAILGRIYAGSGQPLYLVGDPKQAIFGFRGADVFAYLAARDAAGQRFTLDVNQRSDAGVLAGVNALFGGVARPFVIDEIGYHHAQSTTRARPLLDLADGGRAFTIWFAGRGENGKPIEKGALRKRVAAATAGEISRLLRAGGRIIEPGEAPRPLRGSDIAVVVRRHDDGNAVREALAALGIAAVTYSDDSVFASHEATELERILLAVDDPGREALVRAALATDLLGAASDTFAHFEADPPSWERVLDRFRDYHDLARTHGFMRMWRALAAAEGVPGRLLAFPDAARRLTDVEHLAELLHDHAVREDADLAELARLLRRARESGAGDADARQLRLESDEHLVNIVTVFRAKGLQYSIVFCPFLWDGHVRAVKAKAAVFHADGHAYVDLGTDAFDEHLLEAVEEERAEQLRLAYVALTRAEHRCITVWGCAKEAENSALGWLLHGGELDGLGDPALRDRLDALARAAEGHVDVVDLPDAPGVRIAGEAAMPIVPQARPFAGRIAAPWRINSFSGLVARQPVETPDRDALDAALPEPLEEGGGGPGTRSIYSFPRGVQAGMLVHTLFEDAPFAPMAGAERAAIVRRQLGAYGFEAGWQDVLERMLDDVLGTPLDAAGVRLADLPHAQRLVELEFTYPVIAAPIGTDPGFMRGYIDLVFHAGGRFWIVDWKSNWLGAQHEAYAPDRLAAAIAAARYDLQYRIYTVALHRYLATRMGGYDYDRHFGGVYYLFVRAMRPGRASGVYFARPPRDEIEALDRSLRAAEGEGARR
jgi:exodeoxyribonuclease V beta subunit